MNSTRTRAALAGCLLAVAALAAAGLLIGSFPLSFSEILRDPGGLSARVVWQLRLPRTLMGLAGGWALGMLGYFIGGAYYRMNKICKIVVSITVPALLFFGLPFFKENAILNLHFKKLFPAFQPLFPE